MFDTILFKGDMEENFNVHLGKKLRMRRLSLGLTQTKVAIAINVTFQQIQKYEKGANGVSSYRLLLIAKALKIMVSDIFIYAYQDQADMSCLFEQPMETVAEINIKEDKPLILKEEWIVNENKKQN